MRRLFKKILILFLLVFFLGTTGISCTSGGGGAAREALKEVRLVFWTVHDERASYNEILADYRKLHPNVTIEFRNLLFEEYEQELLEAFALGEGPDIFSLHNTWLPKYKKLLSPMPASVRIPVKKIVGTIRQEEVVEFETYKLYTPAQLQTMYGDTVAMDATMSDNGVLKGYGLPLALDTLALYYNKDILNNAGIPLPASYWTDLQAQVASIRKVDADNNILLAAVPLGTADNITRSFDILSLLMMQLKAKMIDENGLAVFHEIPAELRGAEGITQPPGINALEFYTSFADPLLSSYTWSPDLPNSLQAFINGQTAYFLGYAYHRPVIKANAPNLNYAIAPMLQVQGYDRVNYANYWMQTVSNKSLNKEYAWDLVRFMASREEVEKYLNYTERPAALRSLYDSQLQKESIAVFTEQVLTAKSWYDGGDSNAAEDIFADMIRSVNNGTATPKDAIGLAVQRIQQTLRY